MPEIIWLIIAIIGLSFIGYFLYRAIGAAPVPADAPWMKNLLYVAFFLLMALFAYYIFFGGGIGHVVDLD